MNTTVDKQLEEVQAFILNHLMEQVDLPQMLDLETNFVDSRLLDSFAILSLIMIVESRFKLKFQPQELADPALRSVGGLAQAVCSKLG